MLDLASINHAAYNYSRDFERETEGYTDLGSRQTLAMA